MTTEETDKLRGIREQLCNMKPGEERTISGHQVIRESATLDAFRIDNLICDLGVAEQWLYPRA